jgi:RNA polymerase sigma-70 factor (ECF subfamily)
MFFNKPAPLMAARAIKLLRLALENYNMELFVLFILMMV